MKGHAKDASMKVKAIAKWERRWKAGKPVRGTARKHHREAFPKGQQINEVIDEKNTECV